MQHAIGIQCVGVAQQPGSELDAGLRTNRRNDELVEDLGRILDDAERVLSGRQKAGAPKAFDPGIGPASVDQLGRSVQGPLTCSIPRRPGGRSILGSFAVDGGQDLQQPAHSRAVAQPLIQVGEIHSHGASRD